MFDDLKENLKTQLTTLWENIQEQDWYLTLREKFEVLPPATQKITIGAVIGFVAMFLALIPIGNYSTSSEFITSFEDERDLTRQFLKAKSDGDLPNLPPPQSETQLKSRVQSALERFGLQEDQVGEFRSESNRPRYAPRSAQVAGLKIPLKTLNVKQIKDIGFELQNLRDTKLTGMEINTSSKDDHYYDVIFTLKNIALPPIPKADEDDGNNRRRPRRSRRTNNG